MRAKKGVTLIALIITIIVLLILAGVAIAAVTTDNGILSKAQEATTKYKEQQDLELKMTNEFGKEYDEHTHVYTRKITEDKYLRTRANCTNPATYYYVCEECIRMDKNNYYEYGEIGNHVFGTENICEGCNERIDGSPLIPLLTSNTGSNGFVSADILTGTSTLEGSGNNPDRVYAAFDGDPASYVCYGTENVSGGWNQYTFNDKCYITSYTAKLNAFGKTYAYELQVYDYDIEDWVAVKSGDLPSSGYQGTGNVTICEASDFCYYTDKIRIYSPTTKSSGNNFYVIDIQVNGFTQDEFNELSSK